MIEQSERPQAKIIYKEKTKYVQGWYVPKNIHKYVGDVNKIRFMSSWELSTHQFLDNNINVLRWSSETIAIQYWNPVKNRMAKYYPDYWVEYINANNEVVQEILEVKPKNQLKLPRANKKNKVYEELTYAVNQSKWAAAQQFCKQNNVGFRILTENSIFK